MQEPFVANNHLQRTNHGSPKKFKVQFDVLANDFLANNRSPKTVCGKLTANSPPANDSSPKKLKVIFDVSANDHFLANNRSPKSVRGELTANSPPANYRSPKN